MERVFSNDKTLLSILAWEPPHIYSCICYIHTTHIQQVHTRIVCNYVINIIVILIYFIVLEIISIYKIINSFLDSASWKTFLLTLLLICFDFYSTCIWNKFVNRSSKSLQHDIISNTRCTLFLHFYHNILFMNYFN